MAQAPGRELMLALFLLGFGIKVGALPLHVWLPLAHPAAPTPASAILSGAIIKAGLLGWMRFLPLGVMAFPAWGAGCIAVGLAAAFYGVLAGLPQRHPKTVLAYSSISQMGLMTVAIGCGLLAPAAWPVVSVVAGMYALHHALAKGALFLGVGVAAGRLDTPWKRGLVGGGLLLPALALAGAPFTSGAAAKVSIKAVTAMTPSDWPALLETLLPWSAMGTTLLMGRFVMLVWPRPAPQASRLASGLWLPWALLLLSTAVGVFAWPWPGHMMPLSEAFSSKGMWEASWPIGIGALIVSGVWGWSRWRGWRCAWQIPAGDILMPLYRCMAVARRNARVTSLTGGVHQVTKPLPARVAMAPWCTKLTRGEQRLASWRVGGMLFLLLTATLLACVITLAT
jgi:formate hydrogenlyase subunit 3/multisubunit Na+/H+ antiporter MnhD subunit